MIGAATLLLVILAIIFIVIFTGGYNVAATDRHNPVVAWALTTTMTHSVQSRASEIPVPAKFTPAMVAAGAGEYKAMCSRCHGGVGESRAEWAETIRPKPPALVSAARQWKAQEVFWLVKHGVKMTGMPAFGPTHNDATIWNIAAFVKALPDMSAEQYASYKADHDHHHDGEEHHGHGTEDHHHTPGDDAHEH
ncbi:cytochrome c [Altericroceibacterium spongiae]|uniref:Cytochrome c n=2 Tax=Altericroceibacterium spongiae TaxID=2320269 RepID=A0A420EPT2_9SPHN|nr:cytochrome c [Altericroceibacterium spongiae]